MLLIINGLNYLLFEYILILLKGISFLEVLKLT